MSTIRTRSQRSLEGGITDYATRISLLAIGFAGLIFGVLALFELFSEVTPSIVVRQVVGFVIIMSFPIVLGVLSPFASIRVLKGISATYALVYLGELTFMALLAPPNLDVHGDVWLISITAIPAAAAMVASPRPRTWSYLFVMGTLVAAIAIRTSSSPAAVWEGIMTAFYAVTFDAIFVGLVVVMLGWTAQLDQRLAEEARAQANAIAEEARMTERARFESLVHDGVISTLLIAGRAAADSDALARQAIDTLTQLEARATDGQISVTQFAAQVYRACLDQDDTVVWSEQLEDPKADIPATVAEAFEGAIAEAVRNARMHAGSHGLTGEKLKISVSVEASTVGLTAFIHDDGQGFDIDEVSSSRMGIRGSIVGRIRAVGGRAEISSTAWTGTSIVLDWRREG